jgi:hypothetical protein
MFWLKATGNLVDAPDIQDNIKVESSVTNHISLYQPVTTNYSHWKRKDRDLHYGHPNVGDFIINFPVLCSVKLTKSTDCHTQVELCSLNLSSNFIVLFIALISYTCEYVTFHQFLMKIIISKLILLKIRVKIVKFQIYEWQRATVSGADETRHW